MNAQCLRFGIETEYLQLHGSPIPVQQDGIGISIHPEYFAQMVEVVTDAHTSPCDAVAESMHQRKILEHHAPISYFARYASFSPNLSESVRPSNPPEYYPWLAEFARSYGFGLEDLCSAGIHINYSDTSLSPEELLHATNTMRCFAWVLIWLSANSPFLNGKPTGYQSTRMARSPNVYDDVPFWRDLAHYEEWIASEKERGRMYPTKRRMWMPVCFRDEGDVPRIEVRAIDGGGHTTAELLLTACQFVRRVVEYSTINRSYPVSVEDLSWNDMQVARYGRHATIMFFGEKHQASDLLKQWAGGWLADLALFEKTLRIGNHAEQSLRAYAENNGTFFESYYHGH